MKYFLGIDIGGTKISIGLIDSIGEVKAFEFFDNINKDYKDSLKKIIDIASSMRQNNIIEINSIGIASSGPIDRKKGIILNPPNLPKWRNINIVSDLSSALGIPAILEHDCAAAAIAENWIGAGKNSKNMVYITISTGIGAGLILNGSLLEGCSSFVGEIGHTIIDTNGSKCSCGAYGCLETLSSGWVMPIRAKDLLYIFDTKDKKRLQQEYIKIITHEIKVNKLKISENKELLVPGFEDLYKDMMTGELAYILRTDKNITSVDIVDLFYKDDNFAKFLIIESIYYLSIALANLIMLLNPEYIILGGGMTNRLFNIYSAIFAFVFKDLIKEVSGKRTEIVEAYFEEKSTMIGAARNAMIKIPENIKAR